MVTYFILGEFLEILLFLGIYFIDLFIISVYKQRLLIYLPNKLNMLGLAHTVCHQIHKKTCWYKSKCKDHEDGDKQVRDRVPPTKTMGALEFWRI